MAGKLISDLSVGSAVTDTTLFEVETPGSPDTSEQVTGAILRAYTDNHTHTLSEITDDGALAALNTVGTSQIDANSVTNNELRDSAAVSVIGRSANSSGDPADIAAGANDRLLARVSDALSFVQVTIGMIPDTIITYVKLATAAIATASEYRSATSSKLLDSANVWSAGATVSLTDAVTIAIDFSTGFNFTVALGGDRTLGNPSNTKVGQAGCIAATASAATRTLNKGTNWKSVGVTWPISINTSETAYIFYWVKDSTNIIVTGVLNNPT